ncbi:MAG: D-2-hydroxyacid dehydrogenase [Eubacteriales bacterium]|nr:D-2-hydroxyacid dehydrogenase [Eubacteriales bacterium]
MKIVIMDDTIVNPGDLSWKQIEKLGQLTVYSGQAAGMDELIRRASDADIILADLPEVPHGLIEACPKLKGIFLFATGYDSVDLEAAKKRNIVVCNVPSYGTAAVSQYAISLLLAICSNIDFYSEKVHEGLWLNRSKEIVGEHRLIELEGKTMGIIGFGKIGQRVGLIAKAMGMNIIAYNRSQNDAGRAIGEYVTLDELLERSDVISLHAPLNEQSRHIINAAAIEKMKDGVIVINNGRGGLIDSKALADALISRKVYAAGLDVVDGEPIASDDPLLSAPHCIITPHISWLPREARQKIVDCCEENIKAFLEGKPVNNVAV